MQIESGLYGRQGQAVTNFERTIPAPQSDLAQQAIKDPYNFNFLTLSNTAREIDVERGLVTHIRDFLLELGVGFSFVGSQYPVSVDDEDHFIDLLFYHLQLRRYVVIELKAGDFEPEYVGKLNFYLSAVNDQLRHPDDQPSIGLILCRGKKKKTSIEYSLQDVAMPMGVSEYQLTGALPEELKGQLPTIEELEAELRIDDHASD